MSDIGQAAKWIKAGKVVKRKDWIYEFRADGIRNHNGNLAGRVGLSLDDLLADDWEIAPDLRRLAEESAKADSEGSQCQGRKIDDEQQR